MFHHSLIQSQEYFLQASTKAGLGLLASNHSISILSQVGLSIILLPYWNFREVSDQASGGHLDIIHAQYDDKDAENSTNYKMLDV